MNKGFIAEVLNVLLARTFPFVHAAYDTAQNEGVGVRNPPVRRETGAYDGVMVVERQWAVANQHVSGFHIRPLQPHREVDLQGGSELDRAELVEVQSEAKSSSLTRSPDGKIERIHFEFTCQCSGKLVMTSLLMRSQPCIAVLACYGTPLEAHIGSLKKPGSMNISTSCPSNATTAEAEFEALASATGQHDLRRYQASRKTPATHNWHLLALVHIDYTVQ